MQLRRFGTTFGSQVLCLTMKTLLFVIVWSGSSVLISICAQYSDIVFPGPISARSRDQSATGGNKLQMSLELASRIDSIDTPEDFLRLLQNVPANEGVLFSSRIGGSEERSNALMAKQAKCMPELQTVSLKLDNDPATVVYPSCTRINRCGGCCTSSLLTCRPTHSETRNFQVIVSTLTGGQQLYYRAKQIVPLEEHTACKCDCRIREEHCTEKQHYEEDNCECVCDNVDEQEKCRRNSDVKLWNSDQCVCSCRSVQACNTGYYFDHNTCRCRQITFPRPLNRFATTKDSNYNFDYTQRPDNVPPVIIPLDASDPRRKHKEDPEYK